MNQAKVLVVGGYATSGKDSLANFLVSELGWYKTYMSKPLEKALLTLNPYIGYGPKNGLIRYAELHAEVGYDKSKEIPEVRRLLQTLGTEVGRDLLGVDVWLNLVVEDALVHWPTQNVVVTGVRYHNELERFKAILRDSFESIWIHRPGVLSVNRHSSDNTLGPEDFEGIIYNNGSLEDLKTMVIKRFK